MTDDRSVSALSVGGRDPELAEVLDKGLDEYNFAATGTSEKDQGSFSVKVTGTDGEIIGGLTAWTWAGLCGISIHFGSFTDGFCCHRGEALLTTVH